MEITDFLYINTSINNTLVCGVVVKYRYVEIP